MTALATNGDSEFLEVDMTVTKRGAPGCANAGSVQDRKQCAIAQSDHGRGLRLSQWPADLPPARERWAAPGHSLDRRKRRERVGEVQISHGHHRAIKAAEHNDGAIDRGGAVIAYFAKILHVAENITRGDFVGRAICALDLDPLVKLLESVLVGNQRERAQTSRNAMRANVDIDPE